jgi:hypothetical protein
MAISTIYEVSKPTYQFYAVERSGYIDVGTLVTDVITDMTKDGRFAFKSGQLTDKNNFVIPTPEWPIVERLIEIVNPGVGYRNNNILELKLPTGANIKLVVTNVAPRTGAINSVSVLWPGNYEVPAITANTAASLAVFATDYLPINANVISSSVHFTTNSFTIRGNVTDSTGVVPALPGPLTTGIGTIGSPSGSATWGYEYGTDGGGGALGTRWPVNGIWFNANLTTGAHTQGLHSGQFIELDSNALNSANSVIPPGTTIVSINPMKFIGGLKTTTRPPGSTGPATQEERLDDGTYLILSNPVTLRKDDRIIVKGAEARFKNDKEQAPKAWTSIVEAQGSIDPLNDPLGVTGDIRMSGTNSEYIEITSISNQPNVPYRPRIHEGQSVTSTALNGSIGPGDLVYVSEVSTDSSGTIANVRLSRPLSSFTAGETLQFKFDQLQPWRMAFEVLENDKQPEVGPQAVVVYAATEIQLQDNGNISNIFLANTVGTTTSYIIRDRSGIMGGLPSVTGAKLAPTDPTQGFLNRADRVSTDPAAYPFNYALTMTDRGIFWGVWEGTWSTMQKTKSVGANGDSFFNWLLIQRPVNRNTGKVLTKGRAPVFCINSVGYRYWKFIVREEDVLHPTIGDPNNKRQRWNFGNASIISEDVPFRVPADANTQDSFAILNTSNQVALTEDSKYLVSFLHNLSTPRFRYSEELDMIGQTSADVCMAGTDISITAYNEAGSRSYRALPANNPYNTGLRIAVLRDIPQVEP